MNRYLTLGLSLAAGAALLEAALIPGLVIGTAAVLAPRYLPKVLPRLRRSCEPKTGAVVRQAFAAPPALSADAPRTEAPALRSDLRFGQAVAKTITFRIIVTALDFSTNYIVIGDLATAAGLSAYGLVAGPLFYLAHETAWNHYGPEDEPVDVVLLRSRGPGSERRGFTMSRALAKTVTFRTIATVMDFTANYVVVGEIVTAAGLSAFAFVVGPFVYLGHEMAWERFGKLAAPPSETAGGRPAVA